MAQNSCGHGSAAFPILCVVSPVQCGEPGFMSALVLEDFDNCYGKSHLQGFFSSFAMLNLIPKLNRCPQLFWLHFCRAWL